MKILWLSNISIMNWGANKSGTWIFSMYEQLKGCLDVSIIGNVTLGEKAKNVGKVSTDDFEEYYIPTTWINKDGQPQSKAIQAVDNIIKATCPDILHIWGIELCWADICQRLSTPPPIS